MSEGTRGSQSQSQPETLTPEQTELRMSFFEHLNELAARLKRCLLMFIIALVVVTSLPDPFRPLGGPTSIFGYNFLLVTLINRAEVYYVGPKYQFIVQNPADPVFVFMNMSLVLSLVVTLPYIFNEVYGFVAPGLYQREKRAVRKYILPFTVLFTIGGVFGVFVVAKLVMRILVIFYPAFNIAFLMPLNSFFNLILLIPVLTGLAFTFPVFILPLVELKVISVKQLSSARKWVYVLVALAVGIVNPDPTFISSIPIIVPIYVLFEVTVLIAKRIEKKRMATAAASSTVTPAQTGGVIPR